jgi:pimeloyl-ACP methyl ester carboxylesterase
MARIRWLLVLVPAVALIAGTPFAPVAGAQSAQSAQPAQPAQPAQSAQSTDRRCAPAMRSDTVTANGIRIAYESFGPCNPTAEPETVLLIGGTGQQLVEWPMELVQALQGRGYRVVRFDNRDIGLSTHMTEAGTLDLGAITTALQQGTPPPIPYTLHDMANDAVGLLDVLGIEQAHLVGISMGGDIAQLVAIDHPQRVLSLTSIGADSANAAIPVIADPEAFAGLPPPPPEGDRAAFVEYQIASYRALTSPAYPIPEQTLRQHIVRNVERAYDPAGLVRQQVVTLVSHLERDSYRRAGLGKITAPTAIVQGADDPLQPLASAQDLAANIPGAELYVIPGLGHDVPPQLAPVFAAAVGRGAPPTAPAAGAPPASSDSPAPTDSPASPAPPSGPA